MNEAQTGEQNNELDLRILRSNHSQHPVQSGADGPLVSQAAIESEPPRYEVTGNLALKPETNVLDMTPRLAQKLAVVPDVKDRKGVDNAIKNDLGFCLGLSSGEDNHKPDTQTAASPIGYRNRRADDVIGDCDSVEVVPNRKRLKPRTAKAKAGKIVSTKEECDWLKRYFKPLVRKGAAGSWTVRNSGAGFDVLFRVKASDTEPENINLTFPYISRAMFTTLKGLNDEQRTSIITDYVAGHIEKRNAAWLAARLTVAS